MEHNLFLSELKPLVDRTLLFNIIESSCSGKNSHRTAAIELVLERSIQERRKRVLVNAKDALQPDPVPQHQSSEALTPQLQSPAPALVSTPQPPLRSTSSLVVASASAKIEAPQGPSTLSEPRKKSTGVRGKELATSSAKKSSVKHTVELECMDCGAKVSASGLPFHFFCPRSPSVLAPHFKCVGCGTKRVGPAAFCINCRGMFV